MRIILLGSLVEDIIHSNTGKIIKSLGGISYNLIYLSVLFSDNAEIIPVCYVPLNLKDQVTIFLRQMNNVSGKGLKYLPIVGNKSLLRYNGENREEHLLDPLPPISNEMISHIGNTDFIIINMITGSDIGLETLKKLRLSCSGVIYLDIHSLVTKINKDGKRNYYSPKNIYDWLKICDIIQMNEVEFATINTQQLSLEEFYKKYCISAKNLINLTLSSCGSKTIWTDNNKIKRFKQPAFLCSTEFESTGCGDAFLAGFIYARSIDVNMSDAIKMANKVAGINGQFEGLPEINILRGKLSEIGLI